jgi:two-component system chemotaxis sensor kinase CheA
MVNLVGELVIVRSRLDSLAREVDSAELLEALGRLEQVSADLQREVMDTRMVPVEQIFNRFPRMIRDLSRDLGKEVVFDMDGLDIELDRTVLDEIGDPIVHLLRNALDHGLEPAEERVSLGKPRSGSVRLSASREREQVRITVSDDGRGIDIERIWAKAVEQGLCHPRERETMSEADIVLLTFEPGFSTAKEQTKVSGRGVGMDVVKGKIEHFGGAVSLDSSPGIGTSVTLTLPLTLAIVQAVLTESHGHVFALPVSAIDEIIDVAETRIETIDGRPVAVLRDGAVVEFVRLEEAVGQVEYAASPPDPDGQIVLLRVNDVVRGLGVRGLLGRREIVIKPLSPIFREVRGVGGATVLGDGRVALILDPRGLYPTGVRK